MKAFNAETLMLKVAESLLESIWQTFVIHRHILTHLCSDPFHCVSRAGRFFSTGINEPNSIEGSYWNQIPTAVDAEMENAKELKWLVSVCNRCPSRDLKI